MKRRSFLKNTIVASATGVAVSAGILSPSMALAAKHGALFQRTRSYLLTTL